MRLLVIGKVLRKTIVVSTIRIGASYGPFADMLAKIAKIAKEESLYPDGKHGR